jgi:hypothetical protein
MSTVTIPPVLSSPRDDAIQLYRAFKGTSFFHFLLAFHLISSSLSAFWERGGVGGFCSGLY